MMQQQVWYFHNIFLKALIRQVHRNCEMEVQGIIIWTVCMKSFQQNPSNICRSPEINNEQLQLYLDNWFWLLKLLEITGGGNSELKKKC